MGQTTAKPKKRTVQSGGRMVSAGSQVQVYTRLDKKDAERLRKAAANDERSVLTFLRRLIVKGLDQIEAEKGQ